MENTASIKTFNPFDPRSLGLVPVSGDLKIIEQARAILGTPPPPFVPFNEVRPVVPITDQVSPDRISLATSADFMLLTTSSAEYSTIFTGISQKDYETLNTFLANSTTWISQVISPTAIQLMETIQADVVDLESKSTTSSEVLARYKNNFDRNPNEFKGLDTLSMAFILKDALDNNSHVFKDNDFVKTLDQYIKNHDQILPLKIIQLKILLEFRSELTKAEANTPPQKALELALVTAFLQESLKDFNTLLDLLKKMPNIRNLSDLFKEHKIPLRLMFRPGPVTDYITKNKLLENPHVADEGLTYLMVKAKTYISEANLLELCARGNYDTIKLLFKISKLSLKLNEFKDAPNKNLIWYWAIEKGNLDIITLLYNQDNFKATTRAGLKEELKRIDDWINQAEKLEHEPVVDFFKSKKSEIQGWINKGEIPRTPFPDTTRSIGNQELIENVRLAENQQLTENIPLTDTPTYKMKKFFKTLTDSVSQTTLIKISAVVLAVGFIVYQVWLRQIAFEQHWLDQKMRLEELLLEAEQNKNSWWWAR